MVFRQEVAPIIVKGETFSKIKCQVCQLDWLKYQGSPNYISNFCYYLQCLLKAWLTEKEEALNKVQMSNFKDQKELSVSVRRLAVSQLSMVNTV